MNITGWRGFSRVHVRVSVKVDQAQAFVAFAESFHDSGERSDRNRMIAPNRNWQLAGVNDLFNFNRQPLRYFMNLGQVLEFLGRGRS